MYAIFRKEINGFFSSLTGYVVIIVFLLVNSMFMWVLPGEWNVFDSGYAGLDTLFILSPWIFMFLVPAVTMRMIAEEKRLGTIELIFSRPISEREIVYGKYFASVALVLIALLPGAIYYISVYQLGSTPGNLDTGGAIGAFIGLFFLAAVYASAGILASSLTDNQVIAFIIAVTVCFILFIGFDSFAYLPGLKKVDEIVIRLGINEHYKSISRGVIDIRDISYFLAVIAILNEITVFKLQSHKWNIKRLEAKNWLKLIVSFSVIIIVASAFSLIRLRADLTEDNRYTLSSPTKNILAAIRNDIYIQVYLDGEIPIPLKRLKRSVREILDEFSISSGRRIDYEFINPSDGKDAGQREAQYQNLEKKGLVPIDIRVSDDEGGKSSKRIFPGMLVNYNGIEVPVNFLNNSTPSYEENILRSTEGLEYEMIQTIATLSSDTIYKVAFLEGHGEISEIQTADITLNLAKYFTVDRGTIGGKTGVLDNYSAVVIAGPENEFNEADKLVLDQYIMNGGRVLWLFEEVSVNPDSLALGETVGLYRQLNLEDQLFRYGARVNPSIVQDLDCTEIMLRVSSGSTNSQLAPFPWVYYPKLHPAQNHSITRNINKVRGEFVNFIDTVGLDNNIKKTVLLSTSEYAKTLNPPVLISLREAELIPEEKTYNKTELPVAVLLEGIFPSAFKNRLVSGIIDNRNITVKNESISTKMIVVADANIIRNEVRRSGLQEVPVPLGQDKYTGEIYGNRDFLVNCLNYLVDDKGILELRSREIKLRLLNTAKVKSEKVKWQIINVAGPVVLVILAGLFYGYMRKRKYAGV